MERTCYDRFRVITYNVRGLGDSQKRREIFYFLHKKKADVAIIQESHSQKITESLWKSTWGGQICFLMEKVMLEV